MFELFARPADFATLERPTPDWYRGAKFGIFIHWGVYSVPAWAEPRALMGTVDDEWWFKHNAYAEWYANTIRIPGSPAGEYHRARFGTQDYWDLLDMWTAEEFDPVSLAHQFKAAGAQYLIPTTKHHDGITLWDAPDADGLSTVTRGPKRDLIAGFADGAAQAGLHLGLYYSGGLDWARRPAPPHMTNESLMDLDRPKDAEYAELAYTHVMDLVDKFSPAVLWNDIEWPDAGKHFDDFGLGRLFLNYYDRVPHGLVNDRWGRTHYDFLTTEYGHAADLEAEAPQWENCRGVGPSFGYNRMEDASVSMSGPDVARYLVDIVSRGGHFLLNIGLTGGGAVPHLQQAVLDHMGRWMEGPASLVPNANPSNVTVEAEVPWVRALQAADGRLLVAIQAETPSTHDVDILIDGKRHPIRLEGDLAGPQIIPVG